ncbi:hypothetical protein [Achromobacter xylosoxidans]|uniref:hypothetical protein n=2 Tax=Alcaligenaceae TaxID=506 RepID=UPI001CB78FDE|nr:hypothetical protein [Achromobacter xylosoxidans]
MQHFSALEAPALCATMKALSPLRDRQMPQRLRPGTRATLQVRQLMPGEFAWIITLLEPETGNVRSTNYSERRYASQDEASAAGKAAVVEFLGRDASDGMEAPGGGKTGRG